ncbi:transcription factor E2F7 isoform X2 [Pristis pectinata]|uniref:transcription factor E2F7 isoform X2 n=1 Tax=Pristis pectinata TaxID=685728 RepID=UPI00223C9F7A|nr:transcription factor E2F7 isoform X2 [Pristis pectinata]
MECLKLRDLLSFRIGKCDVAPHALNDGDQNAQKENRFRSTPKTPVKTELAPSAVSRRKSCTPDRIQVTPNKLPDKSSPEPWSPTANLRMLISAASPDIRDREKKKELFRQIENERVGSAPDVIQLSTIDDGATDEFEQQRPSRKQKSLGLLCQKFLARYPNYPISTEKTEISLDEVATELGVERRRIYDIVNVLESLQLVSRVAKNQYSWHGLLGLRQTLATLKSKGEQLGYAEQLAHVRHRDPELELDGEGEEKRDSPQENWAGCQEPAGESTSPEAKNKAVSMNSRKDKSLRIMSEKFVMLFLVAEPRTIALDAAAKILIEEGQPEAVDNSKFKTKIRRLYDIANVLTSLGLIKKVHVNERGRKPAFKWVGPVHQNFPDGSASHSAALSTSTGATEVTTPVAVNREGRLVCQGSISSLNCVPAKQFKPQSSLCSPQRVGKARSLDAEESSGKMAQLAAACRLQFEEDIKDLESRPGDGVSRPEAAPSAVTTMATAVASLTKPPAQTDQPWTFCLPNGGKGTVLPPAAAPGSDEGYSGFHRNQPFVLLQSLPSTPVLVMYGNMDPVTESRPSEREEASPLRSGEQKAGNSRKRSPVEQHPVPYGQAEDGKPSTKRRKTLCRPECDSGGSVPSVLSADKEMSSQRKALGNITECSNVVTGTSAQSPTRGDDVDLGVISLSTGTQTEEMQNHSATLENGPTELSSATPRVNEGNQAPLSSHSPGPPSFVTTSGLAENSRCYCLPAASGRSDVNLLLSAAPGQGGFAIPLGHLAPTSLPYQVMVPVFCQTLPTTTSAGGSLHLGLPSLGLLPAAQLLMGGVPISPPGSPAAGCPSPERQVYSAMLAPSSGESPPTKADPPTLQPVTVLKLPQQSSVAVAPKDIQQAYTEKFFHTPVPMAQGKQLEGVQIKTASPAQRKLEIENSLSK